MKIRSMMCAVALLFTAVGMNVIGQEEKAAPVPQTYEALLTSFPDVLATFGDKQITKAQIIANFKEMQLPVEMFAAQVAPEELKETLKQITEGIIAKEIILAEMEKDGFKPSPELVISTFDKTFAAQPAESQEMLKMALQEQGKTLDQYKEEISKNPDAQLQIAAQAWLEEKIMNQPEMAVTDAEVEAFYRENQDSFTIGETVTISHILIPIEGNDAEALAKIESILAKVKQGADFAALAEAESSCPSGKRTRGSLGAVVRGQMVPEFEKAAFELSKKGDLSGVVKTQYGYHIIRLDEDKAAASVTPLEEVKNEIKEHLARQKTLDFMKNLVDLKKAELGVKFFGLDAEEKAE